MCTTSFCLQFLLNLHWFPLQNSSQILHSQPVAISFSPQTFIMAYMVTNDTTLNQGNIFVSFFNYLTAQPFRPQLEMNLDKVGA